MMLDKSTGFWIDKRFFSYASLQRKRGVKDEFDQQIVRVWNGKIMQDIKQHMKQSLACLLRIQEYQRFGRWCKPTVSWERLERP